MRGPFRVVAVRRIEGIELRNDLQAAVLLRHDRRVETAQRLDPVSGMRVGEHDAIGGVLKSPVFRGPPQLCLVLFSRRGPLSLPLGVTSMRRGSTFGL